MRRAKLGPLPSWRAGCAARASDYLDALGMTPQSRAKLGLDLARTTDLATAMSEPNDDRRAELLREAGIDEEDSDAA